MRTREKILILLMLGTVALGGLIYVYFHDNQLEAEYLRWLVTDTYRQGIAWQLRNLFERLPLGVILFAALLIFAAVLAIIVFKILRDSELESLRNRLMKIGAAKTETESRLQEEVWKGRHERQARDTAARELEESIQKIESLLLELDEKERALSERDIELMRMKSSGGAEAGAAYSESAVENSLRQELQLANRALREKDAALKQMESAEAANSKLWDSRLREKDALLRRREEELEALGSEIDSLNGRFGELEAAKKRSEDLLRAEIAQKNQVLGAHEQSILSEQKRLSEKILTLEAELNERDRALKSLTVEMGVMQKHIEESAGAKAEAETRLQKQSFEAQEELRAREAALEDAERKRHRAVQALQEEIEQKNLLLQVRDDELTGLKAEVKAFALRFKDLEAAKSKAETSLAEEIRKTQQLRREQESAQRELRDRLGREIKELQTQLAVRGESLKERERELTQLKTQVESVVGQLNKAQAANEKALASLQQKLRQEAEGRQASDSAHKLLEESLKSKITALEKQLAERQRFVGGKDAEVASLRSEITALRQRSEDLAAARQEAERLLQEAIGQKNELARSNDSRAAALKTLEEQRSAQLRELEERLVERDKLLEAREGELKKLNAAIEERESSSAQALRRLEQDVREKTDLLAEKEAALQALDQQFAAKVRTLELELIDQKEKLRHREEELKNETLRVQQITAELSKAAASRESESHSLRGELKQRAELLQSREAEIKTAMSRWAETQRSLERQLREKQQLVESREAEIDALMAKTAELTQQLAELGAQQERSGRLLQEQLREKSALLEAREAEIEEVKKQMASRLHSLQRQLEEKQKILEGSGVELAEIREQNQLFLQRMKALEAAKEQAESLLQEERQHSRQLQVRAEPAALGVDGAENGGDGHAMETLLNERRDLLKSRDKLIQDLMTELKEKKSQLAKFEIEVWQGIEKREAWKKRLSKFGIRLKD